MVEYLILIAAGYLLMGIFIAGIMDGNGSSVKECDPVCIFLWPALVACGIIYGPAWGAYCVGKKIGGLSKPRKNKPIPEPKKNKPIPEPFTYEGSCEGCPNNVVSYTNFGQLFTYCKLSTSCPYGRDE